MTAVAALPALTRPELTELQRAVERQMKALRVELDVVRSAEVGELAEILAERLQVLGSLSTAIAEAGYQIDRRAEILGQTST